MSRAKRESCLSFSSSLNTCISSTGYPMDDDLSSILQTQQWPFNLYQGIPRGVPSTSSNGMNNKQGELDKTNNIIPMEEKNQDSSHGIKCKDKYSCLIKLMCTRGNKMLKLHDCMGLVHWSLVTNQIYMK